MRAEYVVPLTGKMQSRIEMLEKDRDAASSTAARTKIAKQIESLKKKHVELLAYDEKLRHYADMRIQLDLDDGVKVNYGKVKVVTGGAPVPSEDVRRRFVRARRLFWHHYRRLADNWQLFSNSGEGFELLAIGRFAQVSEAAPDSFAAFLHSLEEHHEQSTL
jgi:hypothetical protein